MHHPGELSWTPVPAPGLFKEADWQAPAGSENEYVYQPYRGEAAQDLGAEKELILKTRAGKARIVFPGSPCRYCILYHPRNVCPGLRVQGSHYNYQ